MADQLGRINVPEISTAGTYPLTADYPFVRRLDPQVVTHRFGNKTEQRFYLGPGTSRYRITHQSMTAAKKKALSDFWKARQGAYGQFTVAIPNDDGTTTPKTCRFADPEITFTGMLGSLTRGGVELAEVPTVAEAYTVAATDVRMPAAALEAALTASTQTIVPLVVIQPVEEGYPAVYLSDRRCTVDGQLYQPRLLSLPPVAQSLGGQADQVEFQLGNADKALSALANDTDLESATISLSLYHVATQTKLDFWKGEITRWHFKPRGPVFRVWASDGLYELTLPYPERSVGRECWKPFKDATLCPYSGGEAGCGKSWEDCQARGMRRYFGGVVATPQTVRTRDNSTGFKGMGRGLLTSSSMVADSVYDAPLQQIYCNITDEDQSRGMKVNAALVAGRDEGDFYTALGIVGAGPLGEYAAPDAGTVPPATDQQPPFLLDGQPHHGWAPKGFNPRSRFGLRLGLGNDPVQANEKVGPDQYREANSDKFSLGEGGEGPQRYGPEMAAGVAFAEVRRSDTKGLQLSKLSEHAMQVTVRKGLSCWKWTGPGARSLALGCTNPVWITVNALLRAKGLYIAPAEEQERYFDVAKAVADAAICDLTVPKLIGTGDETQFTFTGVIGDERPLRDWLQDILNTCLGDFWFRFGALRTVLRMNSSVQEAFTEGNMLWDSLDVQRVKPTFNHLTGAFADAEYGFVSNSVKVYDVDHARAIGKGRPQYLKKTLTLAGVCTKSHAARLITTREREELGGTSAAHRKYHRDISFGSTILALAVEPGMVCSVTHEELPTYPAANSGQAEQAGYVEFRVQRIQLHEDYSVTIEGRTTHDDMYDLTFGPKPKDVEAEAPPDEGEFAPADWHFDAVTNLDGLLTLRNFSVGSYGDSVHQGAFEIFYVDEREGEHTNLVDTLDAADTDLFFFGAPPQVGDYILVESEIMFVEGVAGSVATVVRGQLGTTAAPHTRAYATVSAVSPWGCEATLAAWANFEPGNQLVAPNSEQSTIAEYNGPANLIRTRLPIEGLAAGQQVYSDPRIYVLRKKTVTATFAPRFFRSPGRASFTLPVQLEYAGVAAIRGELENTRGLKSDALHRVYTDLWLHRLRTGGTMVFAWEHPALPAGESTSPCMAITAPESQPFEFAYAEVSGGPAGAVVAPRALTRAVPAEYAESGRATFSGTPAAGLQLALVLTGTNHYRSPAFLAYEHGIGEGSTLTELAAAVAAWLNADPEFGAFYSASAAGAAVVVSDLVGAGGALACEIGGEAGDVTATAAGLASALGVTIGRRYACAFTGDGLRSDLGEVSVSTGPTGGATQVELGDIPESSDPRVTQVELYAAADGTSSDWRHVATVANGSTTATDSLTEAARGSAAPYPGAAVPEGSGSVLVSVKRDGHPWVQLFIPAGQSRSNVAEGVALGSLAAGSAVSFDTENNAGAVALKVVLQ